MATTTGGMPTFVVLGHDARSDSEFSLDDLASGAGRMDLLCRCVGAGLFVSHGIRADARVSLVLQDEVTVTFAGDSLRNARPDERSIAGLVRAALEERDRAVGHRSVEAAPGVSLTARGLETVLDGDGPLVWLEEGGESIVETDPPPGATVVLSDHRPFTDGDRETLVAVGAERVRVGPQAIHADHAISVVQNYFDTKGYTTY